MLFCHKTEFRKNRDHIYFSSLLNPHCPWMVFNKHLFVEKLNKSVIRPIKDKEKFKHFSILWASHYVDLLL